MSYGDFFNDAEIADLKADAESAMGDLFTTYRLKVVGTEAGQRAKGSRKWPDDYAANLTDEPCSFASTQRSRNEQQAAGQAQVRVRGDWTIRCRVEADIDDEDIVVLTTRNNRRFNLVGRTGGTWIDDILQGWEMNELT